MVDGVLVMVARAAAPPMGLRVEEVIMMAIG